MIPPLTLSQASCDALRPVDGVLVMKPTCTVNGLWFDEPMVLYRNEAGQLSERRPTRNELDKVKK